MTSVLLGLCDEQIREGAESNWSVNKLGGTPNWMKESPWPVCRLCGRKQTFICQICCPLAGSQWQRTLYIFACNSKLCWNKADSWSVMRQQQLLKESPIPPGQDSTRTDNKGSSCSMLDWGEGTDDWGDDGGDWGTSSPGSATPSSIACSADIAGSIANQLTNDLQESLTLSSNSNSSQQTSNVVGSLPVAQPQTFPEPDPSMESEIISDQSATSLIENEAILNNAEADLNEALLNNAEVNCLGVCAQKLEVDSELNADLTGLSMKEISSTASVKSSLEVGVLPEDMTVDPSQSVLCTILRRGLLGHDEDREEKSVEGDALMVFTPHYINVVTEPEIGATSQHEQQLMREYSRREGVDLDRLLNECSSARDEGEKKRQGGGGGGGEKYEKTVAKHGDRTFAKFMQRIGRCPLQIIRYSYGGDPVWLCAPLTELTRFPPCVSCGASVLFELQLLPALINFLQDPRCPGATIEFGSVYIYTCTRSCWSVDDKNCKQELVIVHADTDQQCFK